MINFFRQIRQGLLSENKISKYLLYALGEITLVMIGILLAMQVDNWNENRNLAKKEITNLKEIQFNPSQGVLDEIISSGKLGMFSCDELRFALSSWSGRLNTVSLDEQELLRLRYITIDMVRNEGNLRKAIYGPWLEESGVNQTRFQQGNLELLRSVPFEGHMVGVTTMSLNLNNYNYSMLNEEIGKILLLIDAEIK